MGPLILTRRHEKTVIVGSSCGFQTELDQFVKFVFLPICLSRLTQIHVAHTFIFGCKGQLP